MSERGSTQHSARVDDEMSRETASLSRGAPIESRVEEWNLAEPPADGEPLPDARVTVGDVERRSWLAISLRPSAFPGDRERLLEVAEEEHAHDEILAWLQRLPADREFVNVEDVWETLGGQAEVRELPRAAAPRAASDARDAPSLAEQARDIFTAGVEVAVGLTVEVVQAVRRRLGR